MSWMLLYLMKVVLTGLKWLFWLIFNIDYVALFLSWIFLLFTPTPTFCLFLFPLLLNRLIWELSLFLLHTLTLFLLQSLALFLLNSLALFLCVLRMGIFNFVDVNIFRYNQRSLFFFNKSIQCVLFVDVRLELALSGIEHL